MIRTIAAGVFALLTVAAPALADEDNPAEARQQAIAARLQEADRNRCINYGFQEGTDAFAQCRMTLDQQRKAIAAEIIANQQPRLPSPLSLIGVTTRKCSECTTCGNIERTQAASRDCRRRSGLSAPAGG
jgi:hypothetical protein